jgi:hypothetical protein
LVLHQYASEVVEYVYGLTASDNETQRKEMVFAFYGQYFLLLKQMDEKTAGKTTSETTQCSLKDFLQQKPNLSQQILDKIESIVQKLVEKGMSRHSLVQAILADYVVS